jgi:hypothetical protein
MGVGKDAMSRDVKSAEWPLAVRGSYLFLNYSAAEVWTNDCQHAVVSLKALAKGSLEKSSAVFKHLCHGKQIKSLNHFSRLIQQNKSLLSHLTC